MMVHKISSRIGIIGLVKLNSLHFVCIPFGWQSSYEKILHKEHHFSNILGCKVSNNNYRGCCCWVVYITYLRF